MTDDEIFVTCICGSVVNEKILSQHVQDCLKEDFIQKAISLKISHPCQSNEQPLHEEKQVCATCIRCGHPMIKNEGTLITFCPSAKRSSFRFCSNSGGKPLTVSGQKKPVCQTCKLPTDFHQDESEVEEMTDDCIDKEGKDDEDIENLFGHPVFKTRKFREKQPLISQFLETISDTEDAGSEDASDDEYPLIHEEEVPGGKYCKLFHLTLILNDNVTDCGDDLNCQNYSLLLQILDPSPPSSSVGTQTDLPEKIDAEVQVRVLGVYPEEIEELIAGEKRYSVPGHDPAVEAAFRSHLSSLIPCKYCSRTFSPDRIQRHMSCCIDRPKGREYVTPSGGEIPR